MQGFYRNGWNLSSIKVKGQGLAKVTITLSVRVIAYLIAATHLGLVLSPGDVMNG